MSDKEAYLRVARACRDQIGHVWMSGWWFLDKRCAVRNLEGMAKLCEAWAEENPDLLKGVTP